MILKQWMSYDILSCCNKDPIPDQRSFSFNLNRNLLPSGYKAGHFVHVQNGLIELVKVYGIGVGYNKSSFEDIDEFHLT
jgi:hypothetical protein